jgi:WD40 repeat protein
MRLKWIFVFIVSGLFTYTINGVNAATIKKWEQLSSTRVLNQLSQLSTDILISKNAPECLLNTELSFRAIALSSNGKSLIAVGWIGTDKKFIKQWDLATGREVFLPFKIPLEISESSRGEISKIPRKYSKFYFLDEFDFTPDGKTTIGIYYDIVYSDAVVKYWESTTGQEIRKQYIEFDPNSKLIGSIRINQDASTLTWLGRDETGNIVKVVLWNTQANKLIDTFNLSAVLSETDIADAVGDTILARVKSNSTIRFQDLATGKMLQPLIESTHVYTLTFSPNDKILFAGSRNGSISAWDIKTGKQLWSMKGHTGKISALISLNDKTLASGGEDGSIKLWNSADGKAIHTVCVISSVK